MQVRTVWSCLTSSHTTEPPHQPDQTVDPTCEPWAWAAKVSAHAPLKSWPSEQGEAPPPPLTTAAPAQSFGELPVHAPTSAREGGGRERSTQPLALANCFMSSASFWQPSSGIAL